VRRSSARGPTTRILVLSLDPRRPKRRVLARVHDDAWVGGPGAFHSGLVPTTGASSSIRARRLGAPLHRRLPKVRAAQLTTGASKFGRASAVDKTEVLFHFERGQPLRAPPLHEPTEAARAPRLTRCPANNQVDISPDERTLAVVRSYANRPPNSTCNPTTLRRTRPRRRQTPQGRDRSQPAGSQSQTLWGPEVKQVTTRPSRSSQLHWSDPPSSASARATARPSTGDSTSPRTRRARPGRHSSSTAPATYRRAQVVVELLPRNMSTPARRARLHRSEHRLPRSAATDATATGIYRHMGGKDLGRPR